MSRQDLAVEQKVLRELKQLSKPPRRILLALSGGRDSLVMAEILWKWRLGLGVELAVAHVHHGKTSDKKQELYRRRAQRFVKRWAQQRNLRFFTNTPGTAELKSEQEFRVLRETHLHKWRASGKYDAIAFAQHQEDLLETRLIRLIRGSGQQGMRSMSVLRAAKFRPLLKLSAREIHTYSEIRALKWVEDPSNASAEALRNWLRRKWLPSLEKKRPGALSSLSRSLEMLSPITHDFDLAPYVGLRRESFAKGVSSPQQRELLARYLKALGLKSYAQTHVDEIVKRLSTRRGNFTFDMLGMRFHISPDFLWASRV